MASKFDVRSLIICKLRELSALGRFKRTFTKESFYVNSIFPTVRVVENLACCKNRPKSFDSANLSMRMIIVSMLQQFNKQNQMSLIMAPQKGGRAIKRIKIRQRLVTNPEEHRSCQKSTIVREINSKYLEVDDQQKTSPSRMMAQTRDGCFYTQKMTTFYPKNSDRSEKYQTQNIVTNKEKSEIKEKKQSNPECSAQKNRIQINFNTKTQKNNTQPQTKVQKKTEPNRSIHMNYKQYEQLIKKTEISPAYFENVAKKNDDNQYYKDKNIQKDQYSMKKLNKNKNFNQDHYKSLVQEKLPTLSKSKRAKTMRTEPQQNNSMKTIIGCHLGALSNVQIKQKLEQKWIKQQKQIIKNNNNTHVFTQESQMVSEIDPKQQTNRQQFFSQKDKKGRKSPKIQQKINWNMMPNEKFKITLQKILGTKLSDSQTNLDQIQMSFGQQYCQRQQRMFEAYNIYRPKIYVMKHKLEWKL